MKRYGWLVAMAVTSAVAFTASQKQPEADGRLSSEAARRILDPFTGTWTGTFKAYRHDGRLETTLDVRQEYWWDGDVQRGRFIEKDAAGRTTTAEASNSLKDGRLHCQVTKSTGETTTHSGRFADGHLFWFARRPGRVESFKERVVDEGGETFYVIDGFGAYGEGKNVTYYVFSGRYRKTSP